MSLVSFKFLIFCILLLISFFLVPKKYRWIVLLIFSIIFYLFSGVQNIIYILITSISTYISARLIDNITIKTKNYIKDNKDSINDIEKDLIKYKAKHKKKLILVLTLLINFGLLSVFKYGNFIIEQINSLTSLYDNSLLIGSLNLIVPLGISFYTFQTMGYLIDVYWGKVESEKNPFKLLLFTSFFPGITEGPISDYKALTSELFKEHTFDYNNYVKGAERMIYGFFKKIAIADLLSGYVSSVFASYNVYTGITVLIGMFMYSIQIYADFSGYMDIVCGLTQIMDIKLTENFERPYFSKSIAEYWRRWHISLGAWFKSYIYYPIAVSKWNTNLGRKLSSKFGKHVGKNLPATLALIVVWLTTGLWHGANWGYITWGLLNGLIIIFSMWMEPVYDFMKAKLKIKDNFLWRSFQVLRTFVLITFIKVLPEVGSLSSGLGLWKRVFTNHTIPTSFNTLLPFASKMPLLIIIIGTIIMLVVSLLQRKGSVRDRFNKLPLLLRLFILSFLIFLTLLAYSTLGEGIGGFMYAQF